MNEIEKDNQEFDEKIIINQDQCCFCNTDLTKENKSLYRVSFKKDGKTNIGCLCLLCREAFERVNNSITCMPLKTEEQALKEVNQEGWNFETLKAKEEREFSIIH
jgi:hypothetical protein